MCVRLPLEPLPLAEPLELAVLVDRALPLPLPLPPVDSRLARAKIRVNGLETAPFWVKNVEIHTFRRVHGNILFGSLFARSDKPTLSKIGKTECLSLKNQSRKS